MRTISWIAMLAAVACEASSGPSTAERAALPTFSPPAGTYDSARTVAISSTTAGAVIHCTADGSIPTAASPTCAAPVEVSSTTTLRAIATAAGYTDSDVASATYTITTAPPPPRAAAPTFSPPAGTYDAAQTVTISSTTAGAVIHCTQDGSLPTAASPTCAEPIVVSATTTLRAIATAAGYTDSEVAAATFVIGETTNLTKLQAFATKRSWFSHMSVGGNVYRGADLNDASGLGRILGDNPTSGSSILLVRSWYADTADLAAIPAGAWAHSTPNPVEGFPDFRGNGYPTDKINFFVWMLGTTFGGGLDHAGLKFCYSDVGTLAEAQAAWDAYRAAMDALEASFPGRLIYWTVPVVGEWEPANEVNEWLSERIRQTYGSTGRVFDIADWESRDPSGALVLGANGYRKLNAAWAAPDGTHLNAAGANWVAQHYLDFMYRVEVGASSTANAR